MRIVFVGGIHGAGKTELFHYLAVTLGVANYSAGKLIQQRRNLLTNTKVVANVSENQDVLIEVIRELDHKDDELVLLDGHFAVLTGNEVCKIPVEVFFQIHPIAIVVVDVEPGEAVRRLKARDNVDYDVEIMTALRECEVEQAHKVASLLTVPLLVVEGDDREKVRRFIEQLRTQ